MTDIKLSKVQLSEVIQSGGCLGTLLSKLAGPLMKFGVLLTKYFLATLTNMASNSAKDGAIQRTMHGRGVLKAGNGINLVIPNDEIDDFIKIIKSFEHSGVLIEGVTETVKKEIKKQVGGFFGILLGTLGASVLVIMFTGKGIVAVGREHIKMDKCF